MTQFRAPTLMELIERNIFDVKEADAALHSALEIAILCLSRNPAATDRLLLMLFEAESNTIAQPVADDEEDDTNAKTPA